jgi:hypothetical protein
MSEFDVDPFGTLPDKHNLTPAEVEKLGLLPDTSALKVSIPAVPDLSELIPGTNLKRFPRNRPAPPLEEYVAEQVEAVRRLLAQGLKDPRQFTEPTPGDDRMSRAEKYARWRYQGFIDGEIASL